MKPKCNSETSISALDIQDSTAMPSFILNHYCMYPSNKCFVLSYAKLFFARTLKEFPTANRPLCLAFCCIDQLCLLRSNKLFLLQRLPLF